MEKEILQILRGCLQTFEATLQAIVDLPSHLEVDQLFVKVIGESCVPEVAITEPVHGTRERPILNFSRTLINEAGYRHFAVENIGVVKAKVIVEIEEDQNNLYGFSACPDSRHLLQIWDAHCDGESVRYLQKHCRQIWEPC